MSGECDKCGDYCYLDGNDCMNCPICHTKLILWPGEFPYQDDRWICPNCDDLMA